MNGVRTVEELAELEEMIGVRTGFAAELLQHDHWSLIVRTQALLEAALTELLVSAGDARLQAFHERLPLGGRSGKLKAAETLRLLDGDSLRLIRRLTELGVALRGEVRQLHFDWPAFLAGLPEHGRRQWEQHIAAASGTGGHEGTMPLVLAVYAVLAKMRFRVDPHALRRARGRWPDADTPVAAIVAAAEIAGAAPAPDP